MSQPLSRTVAESRWALPVALAVAVGVVLTFPLGGLGEASLGEVAVLVALAASAWLMFELERAEALTRAAGRPTATTYVALTVATGGLTSPLGGLGGAVAGLCLVATYWALFRTYQDRQSAGWTFYAFLCLGLASVVRPEALWLAPAYWLLMGVQLASLSWRTLAASLLGLAAPYWFMVPLWSSVALPWPFERGFQVSPFGNLFEVWPWALVVLLTVVGVVHYYRTRLADKIRVRQLYSCFMTMTALGLALAALAPQGYDLFMRVAVVGASPLLARSMALARWRGATVVFVVAAALAVAVTVVGLWTHS